MRPESSYSSVSSSGRPPGLSVKSQRTRSLSCDTHQQQQQVVIHPIDLSPGDSAGTRCHLWVTTVDLQLHL
ncbi:hypothetical protein JOB18_001575 [Solea senegalensis]|uniref:Uncharacterized protein n=1 Tax=Solea senegalensis TaxID=28829 RepID=A0AAV6SRR7_SOLSE|nr:hypothetical protein JOB18_001575 [Solea senegalensis]